MFAAGDSARDDAGGGDGGEVAGRDAEVGDALGAGERDEGGGVREEGRAIVHDETGAEDEGLHGCKVLDLSRVN